MAVAPTYPGVYVQEVPSGVRTITGVATSIGAFIDWFPRGPMNVATQVFSFADVERIFGGLHDRSEASYGLQQFFLNGGAVAWVVRVAGSTVASPLTTAGVLLEQAPGGAASIEVRAASPGVWGNALRVRITPNGAANFDLRVREVRIENGREVVLAEEAYTNLSTDPTINTFVETVVNPASALINVADQAGNTPPAATGTLGAALAANAFTSAPLNSTNDKPVAVELRVTGANPVTETRTVSLGTDPVASIEDAAARLQGALRSSLPGTGPGPVAGRPEFAQAVVDVVGNRLQVSAGSGQQARATLTFTAAAVVNALGLGAGAVVNVPSYEVGTNTALLAQALPTTAGVGVGADGVLPGAAELIGSEAPVPPTGMYALDKADLFNLLCLPRIAKVNGSRLSADDYSTSQVDPVVVAATQYCRARRAMLLLDPPSNQLTLPQIRAWMTAEASLRDPNVALYFPREIIPDPLNDFRDRSIGPSGTIAGICSRTDAQSGVWVAPAGTDAVLRGTTRLATKLSDAENGQLNPIGINCLRTFDLYGNVSWGARTLFGEDSRGSEWKYIPVRRMALYLEETLFRGTQWVIFEPNDEPLWAQIRISVGAFMADLFRKGAFQGKTRQEAYFVHCDSSTTTPLDQERGIVNLVVGFAPLKPAEFLVITIQQIPAKLEV